MTIYDVAPTILSAAGLEPDPELRGTPLNRA